MPSVTREFDWAAADKTLQSPPQSEALADPSPLQPEAIIYRVGTGWAIRFWDDSTQFAATDDELLWNIAEVCCDLGSRYSAKRLRIAYVPGDKHHDYHPTKCSECECACDPEYTAPTAEM